MQIAKVLCSCKCKLYFPFSVPFLKMFKCVAFLSCCFTWSYVTSKAAIFSFGILLSHLEKGYGVKDKVASFCYYKGKQQKEDSESDANL